MTKFIPTRPATQSEYDYPTFQPNQTVRTIYGETRKVRSQNGCQVFLVGDCHGWYHPTKLFAI